MTLPSDDKILEQLRDERARGRNSVEAIRKEFERENILFMDQRNNKEDTIGDTTFFNIHSAFMARTYIEKPNAKFVDTKYSPMAKSIVDNLNAVLEKDMSEEDMEIIRYQKNHDKYKYGVGAVAMNGWDGNRKMPTWEVIDPRNIIPDPDGDYLLGDYSFFGFETQKRISELPEEWNTDGLTTTKTEGSSAEDETRENSGHYNSGSDNHNPVYEIYHHFMTIEGEKYMVVSGNNDTHILHKEKLKAVTKAQEEDPSLIKFPVILDNWKPERNNIFGYRLATICTNSQMAITLIQNLRYKKSKAELYPMYIYNSRLIKKREDLDFGFNKMIAAKPMEGESIVNAIAPMQKDLRQDNTQAIESMLNNNTTKATGGMNGNIIQGANTERRETLGTNKMVEGNTDVNLSLDDKITGWYEKKFVSLWLEGYLENFAAGDKKIASTNTGMGVISVELSKKDFLSYKEVSIKITTKAEETEKKTTKKNALAQTFAQLQTIERPKISQDVHARDTLDANGIETEMALIYVPKSPDEMTAETENMLLSTGVQVSIGDTDDHLTHIVVHKGSLRTPELEAHLIAHMEAYKRSGQQSPSMVAPDEQAKNIQQGQLGSQMQAEQAQQARQEPQV